MNLNKLFRLLVVGGAVLAGAQACGPVEEGQQQNGAALETDGGTQRKPGGGVDFW